LGFFGEVGLYVREFLQVGLHSELNVINQLKILKLWTWLCLSRELPVYRQHVI